MEGADWLVYQRRTNDNSSALLCSAHACVRLFDGDDVTLSISGRPWLVK